MSRTKEEKNARTRARYQERKEKVFDHYGRICKCCGESEPEFLTIDHINNDGWTHRKERGDNTNARFYEWLVKNNFPEDFQTLCMNCNFAKGKTNGNGICPHKRSVK
jgi:hypothetical protein